MSPRAGAVARRHPLIFAIPAVVFTGHKIAAQLRLVKLSWFPSPAAPRTICWKPNIRLRILAAPVLCHRPLITRNCSEPLRDLFQRLEALMGDGHTKV